jgi:hypothetical protein
MVKPVTPTFTNAADQTYTGNAVEPIIALQNSAKVFTVAGGGLTADLGLNISHATLDPAQPAPHSPGLNA